MEYQLYAVRIFVNKWHESVAFYRDILEFPVYLIDDAQHWAQFQVGSAFIGLELADKESQQYVGRFVGISLAVDDIYARVNTLSQKQVRISKPQKQPWGGLLSDFEDLEGNIVTLLGHD